MRLWQSIIEDYEAEGKTVFIKTGKHSTNILNYTPIYLVASLHSQV